LIALAKETVDKAPPTVKNQQGNRVNRTDLVIQHRQWLIVDYVKL